MPHEVCNRYVLRETRQAAVILHATHPTLFTEIVEVLNEFELVRNDLLTAGGQESLLARRFNLAFRNRGWREARVDTDIDLKLRIMPYRPSGETRATIIVTQVNNKGYKVDNFNGRVALDLE